MLVIFKCFSFVCNRTPDWKVKSHYQAIGAWNETKGRPFEGLLMISSFKNDIIVGLLKVKRCAVPEDDLKWNIWKKQDITEHRTQFNDEVIFWWKFYDCELKLHYSMGGNVGQEDWSSEFECNSAKRWVSCFSESSFSQDFMKSRTVLARKIITRAERRNPIDRVVF